MGWDTHRVEGSSVDGLVDFVGTGDRVGRKQGDNLEWREVACILEALKDAGDAVLRLGDQTHDGRNGLVRPASHELKTGSTLDSTTSECERKKHNKSAAYRAVGERDGTSELDDIAGTDGVVFLHERNEVVHGVVNSVVGLEVRFDRGEKKHRTVGSATTTSTAM